MGRSGPYERQITAAKNVFESHWVVRRIQGGGYANLVATPRIWFSDGAGDSMSCGIPVVTACDSVFIAPNLRRESAQTRLFFPAINLSNLAVLRFFARTY